MGKKGKKKSKKQLEDELLRLQEEQVAQEEEERRLKEEEDARLAEGARIQAELDAKLYAEECLRLQEEAPKVAEWAGRKTQNLSIEDAKLNEEVEWNRFIACYKRPNAAFKNELNTYLATEEEEEVNTVKEALERCYFSEEIVSDLIGECSRAKAKADLEREMWCLNCINDIRQLEIQKIDYATTYLLQHIEDQTVDARSEVRDTWGVQDGVVRIGFWGHLQSKGFRAKAIDHNKIQIWLELPKSIALQSMGHCIGVRSLYTVYDNISPFNCSALTVGGVIRVDLLSIPSFPKRVKTWVMRTVPANGKQFLRLPYPNTENASSFSGALQPCKIEYVVPKTALVCPDPQVSWWDPNNLEWSTENVTDINWDPETRKISFFSLRLAAFAITQPTILDFPYKMWKFQPIGNDTVKLELECARYDCTFIITSEGIKLQEPAIPPIEHLMKVMPPAELFVQLRICGLNLIPSSEDASMIEGVSEKDKDTEMRAYSDLSEIAFAYDIINSPHNAFFDGKKAEVFLRLNLDFTELNEEDLEFEKQIQAVGFWGNKAAFTLATMYSPSDKIAEGLCTHATFWLCLQEQLANAETEEDKEKLQTLMSKIEPCITTARQVENVRQTMAILRPLSVS